MSETKTTTRIQLLTDTPTNLESTTALPMKGEPIVFQDDKGNTTLKIGDGNKKAAELPNLDIGSTKATSITFGEDAELDETNVKKLVALANAVYANEEIKF